MIRISHPATPLSWAIESFHSKNDMVLPVKLTNKRAIFLRILKYDCKVISKYVNSQTFAIKSKKKA